MTVYDLIEWEDIAVFHHFDPDILEWGGTHPNPPRVGSIQILASGSRPDFFISGMFYS